MSFLSSLFSFFKPAFSDNKSSKLLVSALRVQEREKTRALEIYRNYYYAFNYDDRDGTSITEPGSSNGWIVTDNLVSEGGFSSVATEIGIGYSIGSWSIRADIIYTLSKPELVSYKSYVRKSNPTDTAQDLPVSHELDNRIYTGLGLAYWW